MPHIVITEAGLVHSANKVTYILPKETVSEVSRAFTIPGRVGGVKFSEDWHQFKAESCALSVARRGAATCGPAPQQPCAEQAGPGRAFPTFLLSLHWRWRLAAEPGLVLGLSWRDRLGLRARGLVMHRASGAFGTYSLQGVLCPGLASKMVNSEKAFSLFPTVNAAHKTDRGADTDRFMCVNERARACLGHVLRVRVI